ncbi:hypothetical protein D3C85_1244260 [compost metagenome]
MNSATLRTGSVLRTARNDGARPTMETGTKSLPGTKGKLSNISGKLVLTAFASPSV